MTDLTALGALCAKVDRGYLVSLRYGAHTGDIGGWYLTVDLPGAGYSTLSDVYDPENASESRQICSAVGNQIRQNFPAIFGNTHEENTPSLDDDTKKSRGNVVRV